MLIFDAWLSICFLNTYRRQTKRFFQCVTIAWHFDTSFCNAELFTLIDNGKLADEIAMLLPIVVKLGFHVSSVTKQYACFVKIYTLTLNITIIEIIKSTNF